MQVHPLANLLPAMSEPEYRALLASVRANGLREPIVCDAESGDLLDGRHRRRACEELGIQPVFRSLAFDSPEARLAFVLDANLHRRHLDESQRAMVSSKIATMKQGERTDLAPIGARLSQEQAADMLSVSRRAVQRATVVIEHGTPELQLAVDSASVPVSVAEKVARMPEVKQQEFVQQVRETDRPPHQIVAAMKRDEKRQEITQKALCGELPTDRRFPVIYADPPWRYEQQLMGHTDRGVENHYPTMSLAEICALPVKALATDDAILFLWVTVPCVKEALVVMEAWGFEYKTQLVWVKDKIGMGFYVRNQHELLFIGRRGDLPLPEPENRPSSYLPAPRTDHSEKPAEFAALIEAMYPGLPRVELFARVARAGWERWGYESPPSTPL